ncbi:MAG: MG2 domain-containing protein [Planctomycetaceae bacterium]|nr:MG2 domain-containing protein [Planctomycetaceae bacterium]
MLARRFGFRFRVTAAGVVECSRSYDWVGAQPSLSFPRVPSLVDGGVEAMRRFLLELVKPMPVLPGEHTLAVENYPLPDNPNAYRATAVLPPVLADYLERAVRCLEGSPGDAPSLANPALFARAIQHSTDWGGLLGRNVARPRGREPREILADTADQAGVAILLHAPPSPGGRDIPAGADRYTLGKLTELFAGAWGLGRRVFHAGGAVLFEAGDGDYVTDIRSRQLFWDGLAVAGFAVRRGDNALLPAALRREIFPGVVAGSRLLAAIQPRHRQAGGGRARQRGRRRRGTARGHGPLGRRAGFVFFLTPRGPLPVYRVIRPHDEGRLAAGFPRRTFMLDRLSLVLLPVVAVFALAHPLQAATPSERRGEAKRLQAEGNFRDAAVLYRGLVLDAAVPSKDAAADLSMAAACFIRLGEMDEVRSLLDAAVTARPASWRVLAAAAHPLTLPGRGGYRDRDAERNRVLALQLMRRAEANLGDPDDPANADDRIGFYQNYIRLLLRDRDGMLAWRLTGLTDLDNPPAAGESVPTFTLPRRHAPVDADGNPVYHRQPDSWEAAKSDGERYRWLLAQLAGVNEEGQSLADLLFGRFLMEQFGVQTITANSPLVRDADIGGETGPYAVRTLLDAETVARLATGLKRFSPPEEFNHIAVLRSAAESQDMEIRADALAALAQVYENRQQYPRAVAFWQRRADLHRRNRIRDDESTARLERITGNNGLLESGPIAPAGQRTTLSYLYRNGKTVTMVAKRLDEKKLLADIRDAVKGYDASLLMSYERRSPEMLGRMVVEEDESRYVAETVAEWDVALDPLPDHYSRRAELELPFDSAGCYLVEARLRNGNTSRLILWIHDLALVRKNSGDRQLLFAAEAANGRLVPSTTLSFLGYGVQYDRDGTHAAVLPDEFAARTDEYGLTLVPTDRLKDKEWLITAETDDGRLAYLGFDSVWPMYSADDGDGTASCFVITDRPAYRPGQDIDFKIWYGLASYDGRNATVEDRPITVTVRNPRGETVYEKRLTTDAFGGAADTLSLGPDAMLGMYYIETELGGGVGFRLEEYKKPEFEVSLETPDKAIGLGDTAQVKIRARYYYGAPVTEARVSYRVVRTTHRSGWTPPWRWDWLYGAGAWQNGTDYSWYPGSAAWALPIRPPWFHEQPEVVAEGEGVMDADGVFRLNLDTAPAKELFGDRDHAYAVTAEVTDASRRTISGGGKVIASRRPFAVTLWTDRGFYPAGDRLTASVRASLPTGGGVEAAGRAVLYRIRYDEAGAPSETEVASQAVATDKNGDATVHFTPAEAGQYRLASILADADGNEVEGATLVTVRGAPGEGDFRFGALELVPDQRDYAPGDMVRLAINSRFKNATVLLFPRAERAEREGALLPLLYHLGDGSEVVEIPVSVADQPNFFCEAITIHGGTLYRETREIFVPPADKTLTVEVTPDKTAYAPGEKATFTLRVSDATGRPVVGQCVVSMYDRSIEYISGGPNVGDIRSFFWSWRRYYNTAIVSSLSKTPYAPSRRGDVYWEPIGAFGNQEADWNDETIHVNGRMPRARRMSSGGGMMLAQPVPPPSPAAPMQAVAMEMASDSVDAAPAFAGAAPESGGGTVEPALRSEFADTALWLAALETDADGVATFSLAMPENLTAWKTRTWVMAGGVRVGEGEEAVATKKDIIVRPQAPHFLTQTDQVVLSANLHNYLPRAKAARAELVLEGGMLEVAPASPLVRHVQLAANGEARVNWLVNARRPGDARVVMRFLTDEESDAAEITVPVVVHGARRVESFGGVMRGDRNREVIAFTVPEERLPDRSRFEFSFSPSIAGAMLEAIPYLVDYPYGCTEQTLNRFLPVVMTRRFLDGISATLADAQAGTENTRDDPQSATWRNTWGDDRTKVTAVFDDEELAAMTARGVERLAAMQNEDGGWGWFSGAGERSWPHTTAVVVYGLLTAAANDVPLPRGMLDGGIDWLRGYQAEQIARLKAEPETARAKSNADNIDAFVYMVLALDGRRPLDPDMRDFLYRDRLGLSPTALAMLGIALHQEGATNALAMVVRNLSQFVKTDEANGTAWLQTPAQGWWWWYNDAVETQAWYLKLLSRVEPRGDLASGVAKYLLQSRKNGSYWRSTRDTAYAIDALAEYASASGEADPTMEVIVTLDGVEVMRRILTAADIVRDNRLVLEGLAVEPGDHELQLERTGTGTLYYAGSLDVFSLEDPIRAAGSDLTVTRRFYKLEPGDRRADMPTASGTSVQGTVEGYRRVELPGLDSGETATVQSGDLVEVELTIDAKNDYEYLVFEDMKAAGLEAVEVQSGYTANRLGAYVEYRDQKVVLFIRSLPRGTRMISYRFRAEAPGAFSALPTFGGGMYATELFTNSDEMKLRVGEAGTFE